MFKCIFETVGKEISGENAKNLATEVTRFHRIQVSPHFREAAVWCQEQLRHYNIQCNVHSYTADGEKTYWTSLLPEEWKVESAYLEIEGKVWAEFRDVKVSLIQRSHPVDIEAELIHIEHDDEEAFREVQGKIVHSPLPLEKIKDLALHYGAAGIITSGIRKTVLRTRLDVPDAVHYYSFWGEKGSGFILSPRKGEILKKMIRDREKENKGKKGKKGSLTAKMVINTSLYPGAMEVVDAFIPGETEEEVLVVAHLCHPQPSANDNASGCGALMEVARALTSLIAEKKLKAPKRSIRFLLVPEMHGTIAYLATNEEKISSIIAGINLDMVGENQEKCRSSLLLERTPDALPSCINDLAEIIFEELTQEVSNFSQTTKYATFRHAITSFSGGSDHYVLSDPSVGIPCPMVIHWPDLFYHSSQDTPEKLDSEELKRVATLTGTYAYFLADAGKKEASWLAFMICEKAKERIIKRVKEIVTDLNELKGKKREDKDEKLDYFGLLDYLLDREIQTLRSVNRLAPVDTQLLEKELETFITTEKEKIPLSAESSDNLSQEVCTWVPTRIFRGPISMRKTLLQLSFEKKKAYRENQDRCENGKLIGNLAVYWADGNRTLSEINTLITYEIGRSSLEYLKWYFKFLEEHGLIELQV